MVLSEKEVKHVAHLARIELSPEEIAKFQIQLTDILDYVGALQSVETRDMKMSYSWDDIVNMYREDEVKSCEKKVQENILAQAPASENNFIKVKSVFN